MSIEETIAAAVERIVTRVLDERLPSSGHRLVNRTGAARILGIHPTGVDSLRKAGEIPWVATGEGPKRSTPMFDVADLEAWIKAQKRVDAE